MNTEIRTYRVRYIDISKFLMDKCKGYLAEVCEQWELEALRADKELGIRTVCMRFAPILSSRAGLLAKLLPIFSLGLG